MTHCLNLSTINSVYGFDAGERVVQELVQRLKPFVHEKCQLFHFATNRFVLFVKNFSGPEGLRTLVKRIHTALEAPLDALGIGTCVTAKTGIVELNTTHHDAVQVFTQALVALQHAEDHNDLQNHAFFDDRMAARLHRQETIARELRGFLIQNLPNILYIEYQPKVHLKSNRIVGFEALARMNSPALGAVPPDEFIKVAERQDLIIALGYWVLENACQFIKRMAKAGYPGLTVAVNVSGIQLLHDKFISQVRDITDKAGIKGKNLELEITESVLIEGFSHVRKTLTTLRGMGIRISIDDFGTGYSSLARMEVFLVV